MSPADPLSSMNTPIIQYFEVLLALGGVLALAYATLKIGLPRIFGMRTPGTGPTVCPRCGGSGRIAARPCPECEGTGQVNVGIGGA